MERRHGPGALPPEMGGLGALRHDLEPGGAAHQPGDHARHDELGAVARHRDHRVDEHRSQGAEVRLRAQALPDHVHHRRDAADQPPGRHGERPRPARRPREPRPEDVVAHLHHHDLGGLARGLRRELRGHPGRVPPIHLPRSAPREAPATGFRRVLPTGRCDIPYVRNLTTAPLAALVPFTSVELMERGRHVDGSEPDVQELHLLQPPRRRRAQRLHPGQAGPRQVGDGQEHDPVDAAHRPHRRGHRARPRARVHQRRARDGRRGRPDLRRLAYLYQPVRSRARGGRTAARDEGRRHHVDGRDDGQEPLTDTEVARGPRGRRIYDRLLRHARPADIPTLSDFYETAQPAARARGRVLATPSSVTSPARRRCSTTRPTSTRTSASSSTTSATAPTT